MDLVAKAEHKDITKEMFEETMGFKVLYIDIVGRKNQKRIKFACNYLRSQTISVEEFMALYDKKEENEKIIL